MPPNFNKSLDYDYANKLNEREIKKIKPIDLFEYRDLATNRIVHISRQDALNQPQFIRTLESVKSFI